MTLPDLFAVGNHLWQSTALAAVAWLLTLLLRKNSARVRHAIWFVASLKFLVPISWLIALGGQIHWRNIPAAQPAVSVVIAQISEPFSVSATPSVVSHAVNPLPMVLFGVWLVGALGIAVSWMVRYWRISKCAWAASSLPLDLPVKAMSSSSAMEPGVFGIFRPVLLLPEGIFERLTESQLGAVIEHELCHVRHRDNLVASIQMFVETVFWFHPLVWWIGKRMVAERELACDEEVLRLGSEPRVYAEGILNVCKLYVRPPLVCMSGVAGSDLKQRIEKILDNRRVRALNLRRKVLLVSAAILAVTVPIVLGVMYAPSLRSQTIPPDRPAFEVASVKLYKDDGVSDRGLHNSYGPQGVDFRCTLAFAIGDAYSFPVGHIVGPGSLTKEALWGALSQGYDIVAKAGEPVSKDQLRLMLQSLLADRFKLTMHREARTGPVYRLTVAKGGPRLEASKSNGDFSMSAGSNGLVFANAETIRVSGFLTGRVDRTVVDQTGLKGLYNFTLRMPQELREDQAGVKSEGGISAASPSAAAFAEALKDLGLQLVAGTAPVDYLVVDHVEKPSEN